MSGPAVQRAQRVLDTWVRPAVTARAVEFDVAATAEWFDPVPFIEARDAPVEAFRVGDRWGRPWHTRWFRLRAVAPEARGGTLVAHVDLGFSGRADGFQVEGLAYVDGRIVHGVQPDRRLVRVGEHMPGSPVEVWVEAVAIPMLAGPVFGYEPTLLGDPATAPAHPLYTLRRAELAVLEPEVQALAVELHALIDLVIVLDADDPLRARAFRALDHCLLALDRGDVAATAPAARAALAPVFDVGAAPGAHRLVATGHAHLDTAWLWPLRETRRKAVRTFANAVDLLRRHPDHHFTHSQAQHYAWVAEDAPELFAEVQALVREGRWEPAGGMWVETDLNLPSGESLVRQLVHGQRAFAEWFDLTCPGGFLPDDFGYPASLPQLLAGAGCRWFFTQKLSWNDTNRFPHHTFWWEGIDGTRVLSHFSPIDTYNARLAPAELRGAARRFADHAGASSSLVCFGHGDGGGGATDTMLARARLSANWQGTPAVRIGSADGFFAETLAEYGDDAPVWVGELYLEKHRGTYSSQVATKQGNRRCELALHEAELWSASAGAGRWPGAELGALWREVLTQQFHDILPGSSIAWVHQDAEAAHARVAAAAEELVATALGASAALGASGAAAAGAEWVVNPAPVRAGGVVDVGGKAAWVDVAAFGASELGSSGELPDGVEPVVVADRCIRNGIVELVWDGDGRVVSLRHLPSGREVLPVGSAAGTLVLRRDHPAEYDAWDIDETDTRGAGEELIPCSWEVVESGPLRALVVTRFRTEQSTFELRTSVVAGSARVDHHLSASWHEDERRLQSVLPVDVLARSATCGIQFGHVQRPRHANTTWDAAMFEVCAHRYVHVGEPGFGVAVLADGPRGYDVRGPALALTLLRAARYPDPSADRGQRDLHWSWWVHDGDPFDAGIETEAHRLAHPVRVVAGRPVTTAPIVDCAVPGVLVGAVKRAEDGSGDLVVRLWETRGARTTGHLTWRDGAASVVECDLLERPLAPLQLGPEGTVAIAMRPFQVLTLRAR
ncbi:MAG: alpha-mannosidase [Actinomycetota bacterium]|nr:MAG: alpha-mannosidase [Actinomycetota bacterium]